MDSVAVENALVIPMSVVVWWWVHVSVMVALVRPAATGTVVSMCPMELDIDWGIETEAAIYSTPVLSQIYGDSTKQIVATTFYRHLEVVDHHGHRPATLWPVAFDDEKFYGSALLYDVDFDGGNEMIATDVNGRVRFLHVGKAHFGEYMKKYDIGVPRLRVLKNWYVSGGGKNGLKSSRLSSVNTHVKRGAGGKVVSINGRKQTPEEDLQLLSFFHDSDLDGGNLQFETHGSRKFSSRLSPDKEYVFVDSHVLTSPTIGHNFTQTGHDVIIVPISYYFDEELFSKEFGKPDTDAASNFEQKYEYDYTMYVAGGLACYDLTLHTWLWTSQLDLTSAKATLQAHIYSSPIVVDIEGDGSLDVIVGTSLGFIYVLNGKDGTVKDHFPIKLKGGVEMRIVAENLRGNENLELFAIASSGHATCFDGVDGKILWERNVRTGDHRTIASGEVALGDVNGDGNLDIVFGLSTSLVWALDGESGAVLDNFPFYTGGKILAPVVLSDLRDNVGRVAVGKSTPHVIVPSLDGFLYIIDGTSGCANMIDFSEHSYAAVLVDDINNDGLLELIFSSMNGNIYAVRTKAPFHPLLSWTNGGMVTYRKDFHGVLLMEETRKYNQVVGQYVKVEFEIVDKRMSLLNKVYRISLFTGSTASTTCLVCGKTFSIPGKYVEYLDLKGDLISYKKVLVFVVMTNEHNQRFEDSAIIMYNPYLFDHSLPWVVFAGAIIITVWGSCVANEANRQSKVE